MIYETSDVYLQNLAHFLPIRQVLLLRLLRKTHGRQSIFYLLQCFLEMQNVCGILVKNMRLNMWKHSIAKH
jgi:hypothetical protein